MTEQGKKVLMLLIEGKNYAEIGAELGMTRQGAHECAKKAIGRIRNYDKYHYPNLAQFIEDKQCTITQFARDADVEYRTLMEMLQKGRAPSWKTIAKLAEYTGMTAEELMYDDKKKPVEKADG